MDVRKAANELAIVINRESKYEHFSERQYGDKKHLIYMCEQIIDFDVTGEKAHRCIGWLQGCIYMKGWASLEDMKQLNKNA